MVACCVLRLFFFLAASGVAALAMPLVECLISVQFEFRAYATEHMRWMRELNE